MVFSFEGKTFRFSLVSVYDGDTCTLTFHHDDSDDPVFKAGARTTWNCRLCGINCPEMRPPLMTADRDQMINLAVAARDRLSDLLQKDAWVASCQKFDKYGRVLVSLKRDSDGKTATDILLAEGHGSEYKM